MQEKSYLMHLAHHKLRKLKFNPSLKTTACSDIKAKAEH